jgi:hypothetical protein
MIRNQKRKKAQSTLEYAVIIACVVAGLLAMQIYIKRGFQGRFRESADSIGEQYSPTDTSSNITMTFGSDTTTTMNVTENNGISTSITETNSTDTQGRSGSETVAGE